MLPPTCARLTVLPASRQIRQRTLQFQPHPSTNDFPFHNMKVRRMEDRRCFSPSRVTANLLLSFLALSTPSQARDQAPINSPIAIPPLVPGIEPSAPNSYHDFVRIPGFLIVCTS